MLPSLAQWTDSLTYDENSSRREFYVSRESWSFTQLRQGFVGGMRSVKCLPRFGWEKVATTGRGAKRIHIYVAQLFLGLHKRLEDLWSWGFKFKVIRCCGCNTISTPNLATQNETKWLKIWSSKGGRPRWHLFLLKGPWWRKMTEGVRRGPRGKSKRILADVIREQSH